MFKEAFESVPRDAFSSELATIAQLIQKILVDDHIDLLDKTEKLLKNAEEECTLFQFGIFFEITEQLFIVHMDIAKISIQQVAKDR